MIQYTKPRHFSKKKIKKEKSNALWKSDSSDKKDFKSSEESRILKKSLSSLFDSSPFLKKKLLSSFFLIKKRKSFSPIFLQKKNYLKEIKKAFFLYIRRKKLHTFFFKTFFIHTPSQYMEKVYVWKNHGSKVAPLGIFPVKPGHFEYSYRLGEGILLFAPQKFYIFSLLRPEIL
jgi:hypothetical protein